MKMPPLLFTGLIMHAISYGNFWFIIEELIISIVCVFVNYFRLVLINLAQNKQQTYNPRQQQNWHMTQKGHQTPNPFSTDRQVFLPSNLLNGRKTSHSKAKKMLIPKALHETLNFDNSKNKHTFIQQRSSLKKKDVLYKRLSNIRVDHEQLVGISFSKLLSRMVIMDDEQKDKQPIQFSTKQSKIKNLPYVRCLKQTVYNLQYNKQDQKQQNHKIYSKSIDLSSKKQNYQDDNSPSKKIFKRFYMPHSQVRNPGFFNTVNPEERYIYKNGKRVQCKRIHNFYTSHMFKKGYDKFFRKTIDFTESPKNKSPFAVVPNHNYDSLNISHGQDFSRTFYAKVTRGSDCETKQGFRRTSFDNKHGMIKKWQGLTEQQKKQTPKQFKRPEVSQRY